MKIHSFTLVLDDQGTLIEVERVGPENDVVTASGLFTPLSAQQQATAIASYVTLEDLLVKALERRRRLLRAKR